jgi:hypothetical protein
MACFNWLRYQGLEWIISVYKLLDIWEMRHFLRWLAHRRLGFRQLSTVS